MLFDNDFNSNMDMDYNFLDLAALTNDMNYNNINNDNNKNSFFSSKDGFLRGNMFKDEYKPYKNLTFINIRPKSDREAKLFNVMQYSFAITDMNLYLDVHPNDKEAFRLLKQFIKEAKDAKKEYVNSYGPLKITNVDGDTFDWLDNPWPWDNERGDMYV